MDKQSNKWAPVVSQEPVCVPPGNEHCITCSDEAKPATVLCVDHENGWALVQTEGATREVDITLVTAVLPGDTLLVHGGVAISRQSMG